MTPVISIVTPVFNRAESVIDSIKSSLDFLQESGISGEIIVVDDASSDRSFDAVSDKFQDQIVKNVIRIIKLPFNIGPTGAKQVGAVNSCGQWLIFMDSDDLFIASAAQLACISLMSVPQECPIVFFRCINKVNGKLIGPSYDSQAWIDLQMYLKRGTPGECLPAVRRDYLLKVPYSTDLRGFESLTYAQLIQKFGPACLSPIILRSYCTDDSRGRLSSRRSIRSRGCLIAKGYARMIILFGHNLRGQFLSMMIHFFYHSLNCLLYSFLKKIGFQK